MVKITLRWAGRQIPKPYNAVRTEPPHISQSLSRSNGTQPQSQNSRLPFIKTTTLPQPTNNKINKRQTRLPFLLSNKKRDARIYNYWGDKPTEKEENIMRLATFNLHNPKHPSMMAPIISNTQNYEIDLIACQEIGLDINQHQVRKKLHEETYHLDMNQALIYASSPQSGYESGYKFGGTMIHVKGKWTTRFTPILEDKTNHMSGKGYDPYGRWCWVTLQGNTKKKITFISAYRVNANTFDKAGAETIWQQEYNCHLQAGKTNPNPRNLFLEEISEFIYKLREERHSIFLMLDANESLFTKNNPFKRMVQKLKLVDCLSYIHPTLPDVPTYEYGSTRVDYILCTPELKPCLKKEEYFQLTLFTRPITELDSLILIFNMHLRQKWKNLSIHNIVPFG